MKVKDIMETDLITLKPDNTIQDLIKCFSDTEVGSVIIINDNNEPIHIITLRDLPKIFLIQPSPSYIKNILKALNKTKKSLITISANKSFTEALTLMNKFDISHIPVINNKNKLIGILSLRNIVKSVPEVIYLDPLTEVNNRLYLDLVKQKLKKSKGSISVLMIDLDNFKNINDTYGHLLGDVVLKNVAKTIKNNVKISDEVIRYGGEEFLVIAYRCDLKTGKIVAERLRKKVEKIKIKGYPDIHITVSIGVACYHPGDDLFSTIEKADKAMYQAKRLGKNRVEIWKEDIGLNNLNNKKDFSTFLI
ncbi:GGDEF domain-containing protein [Thermodesulfobacterium hydrogeniphilum]|uniref:GGDEF domain-containing protein n=1 Tax=Thermodesulfobacterium hydrogeniphilum TaxID=161156 RepID=UPI00068C1142|nr:GGDEF domain-containing protein [Thermodesulfobacterium hydrogeniphilum]